MIGRLLNQGQVVIFGSLLESVQVYYTTFVITNYVDNYVLLLHVLSIFVTTTQYQPPTKVCVANRLISEKMISFLILFVLAFFSLFADQFLRFLSFQLIQIFFWEPDVVTREELIPCCWLLVGMFQQGTTEPQETEWLERLATNMCLVSLGYIIRHNFHIT